MATRIRIAPKGMGLNDFVAAEEGFFAAEGLDIEFDWKTFRGTQSSWKHLDYFQRPQDQPYADKQEDLIQGACAWGSVCNASAGMGRFVHDCYGISPWAILSAPIPRSKDRKTSRTCRSRSACAPAVISTCHTGLEAHLPRPRASSAGIPYRSSSPPLAPHVALRSASI